MSSSRVFSGSAIILASQVLTLVLVFFAQRVILSTLTAEANGLLFIERRVTEMILVLLADFGLNSIVIRRVVQNPERRQEILSSAVSYRVVMWFFATSIACLYALYAGYSIVDICIWSVYYLIAARTTLLRYTLETQYRASSQFTLIGILAVLDALLFYALIETFRSSLTPSLIIAIFAASALPGFLVLVLRDRGRTIRLRFASVTETKSLLKEAVPVVLGFGILSLHDRIDALILSWLSSAREVGILGAVYTSMGPVLGVVPVAVSLAVMPEVARLAITDSERCSTITTVFLRGLTGVVVVAVSGAVVLIPWFVDLVAGGTYNADTKQFVVFAWTAVPMSVLVFSQELAITLGRRRIFVSMAVLVTVSAIVLCALLIPAYDSLGAVIAKCTAVSLGSIAMFVSVHRMFGKPVDWSSLIRLIACMMVGIAVSTYLPSYMDSVFAFPIVVIVTGAFVYGLGVVRKSDIALIRSALSK